MTKLSARQKLLNAAAQLFYNHGISATGVDTIIAQAGVAKMSLYNNFASKSDLVAAYIQQRHQQWLMLYQKRCANCDTPQARILAIFDAYQDHANCEYERGFRGCGLLNAAAEMPAKSPERDVVKQHKQEVAELITTHLNECIIDQQDKVVLTNHLCFLLEGAISLAGLEGNDTKVTQSRQIAEQLIKVSICPTL